MKYAIQMISDGMIYIYIYIYVTFHDNSIMGPKIVWICVCVCVHACACTHTEQGYLISLLLLLQSKDIGQKIKIY
jgi:hypothetical protein